MYNITDFKKFEFELSSFNRNPTPKDCSFYFKLICYNHDDEKSFYNIKTNGNGEVLGGGGAKNAFENFLKGEWEYIERDCDQHNPKECIIENVIVSDVIISRYIKEDEEFHFVYDLLNQYDLDDDEKLLKFVNDQLKKKGAIQLHCEKARNYKRL